MNNILVPDIDVARSLIKKFIGGENGEKYTINIFVVNPQEAVELIKNSSAIITPVQYVSLATPASDSLPSTEIDNEVDRKEPTETKQEKKIRLKALRASLIHKAVGQQFSMDRFGHTATFTVTKDGKFLGENGIEYDSPSRACGGIWESKGAGGTLACNGYECRNKEGLTIDEVIGVKTVEDDELESNEDAIIPSNVQSLFDNNPGLFTNITKSYVSKTKVAGTSLVVAIHPQKSSHMVHIWHQTKVDSDNFRNSFSEVCQKHGYTAKFRSRCGAVKVESAEDAVKAAKAFIAGLESGEIHT
jgi:hypothetical protein